MPTGHNQGASTEAIERVARAIFDSHNAAYRASGKCIWESDPDHWRRYARAALVALVS